MNSIKPYALCSTCTIMLVKKTYERAWWFRMVREPLRWGMIALGWLYGIDPEGYPVRSEQCRGCLRFMKTALKDRSALFNRLNGLMNPLFDRIIERIVTAEEIGEAKRFAKESARPIYKDKVKYGK
ncbi:MAG: hypothetical protein A2176_08125 [Spirochaetes bacterium RBG_13_51_14]|nr:MAG: hypothetical protein A2176_08125 [Spirochaetes bacterium RBG_13_51_14]